MTTKTLRYDAPAYHVPVVYSGSTTVATANGTTAKFAAFTAQKIKMVVTAENTNGTTSMQPLLYKKSGTSTSTSTLSALTSAEAVLAGGTLKTNALDISLIQGDQFWVTHGTDATASMSVAIETYVIPGSNLTA